MARNILAVLAGFVVWTVLWLASNSVLSIALPDMFNEDGSTDSAGMLAAFLVISIVCSFIAGYLCVMLARERPMQYAVILGVVLFAVGLVVQIIFWDVMPIWYHLLFLVMLIPGTLLGAKIRLSKSPVAAG